MDRNNFQFKDSSAARTYISGIAYQYDNPEHMMEFLRACDIVCAALVRNLLYECRYRRIQRGCLSGESGSNDDIQSDCVEMRDSYVMSYQEFTKAKDRLQKIVGKLKISY